MSFSYRRVEVAPAVSLNVAMCGSGSPIVLLHGFPQTHLMWRHVAPRLAAAGHTVICPDLRGYGDSDKPDGTSEYAKRVMAADVIALAEALGFERFALAGHDRGALVAIRAGLDHPDRITHLASLDVLPTLDSWEVLRGLGGVVGFHLFLMAAPAPLPELLIAGAPDAFFGHFLDAWGNGSLPAEIRQVYLTASRHAIPSIVADYRATATIDVEHDSADRAAGRRLAMPVTVLQQDWGAALGFDAAERWRAWAADLAHHTVSAGHFMAEEEPDQVVLHLLELLARNPASPDAAAPNQHVS
ncbi:alpha/beta fold hydrolase [Dactylosporangium sp. CS-047395]|uniref:alpha/beta fold hydrolase n=1 Tax=Dactylosporangium sp. CS-047395 TaxID=3239936 RepID=UPI003D90D2E2